MYRFGDFEVDPRARELRRSTEPVHLEPQAFDLLVHLIEHRDEVVANRDLLDGVWGHRFVSEAAITTRIKEIRRAVGDDGTRQHTIRNVRGRGYQFVAELQPGGRASESASGLIGRDDELAWILDRLDTSSIVTIAGPGGIGKSTLARAVVARSETHHRDGVHIVELAPLERPEQVLPAIARTLGIVLDPDAAERTVATIGRLEALVFLDNCEHVADEVADLVQRATVPGGPLHVLSTSQVRLGVAGEQVMALDPLDRTAALRLFETRAQAIRRDWDTDSVGADRVLALLDHLDRLPLTIEMAAARLGSMTFDELESTVVAGGGWPVQMTHRTPSRRHRSLRSLVEWSAALLDADHRRVFEDCSVFAGAVSVDDAVPVLALPTPGDVMSAFGELADRSLLSVDLQGPVARYRMLDSVKGVARGWLASSDRSDSVHHRHAVAVVATLGVVDRDLRRATEPVARDRFDSLVADVRQAHRWSVDHEPELAERLARHLHLASYGRLWNEPAAWSRPLVAQAGETRGCVPASRLLMAGAAVNAGQLDPASVILERVFDELDSDDDAAVLGIAHEIMSDLSMYAGDLAACAHHVAVLDAIGRDLDDPHMIALAATNDSLRLTFSGAPDAAMSRLDLVDRGDLSMSSRAWHAYARGEACSAAADHAGAFDAYGHAIELASSVDNPFVVSVAQSSLASEHARAGGPDRAIGVYAACLDGYRRHGNVVHAVTTLRNLVGLLADLGDDRSATIIGAAVLSPELRPSYGSESDELTAVLESVSARVGRSIADEWTATGDDLGIDEAIVYARSALIALADRR